jgi:hypothetical protein
VTGEERLAEAEREETLRVLREVRHVLSAEERWTKHMAARDGDGKRVQSCDSRAAAWCLHGAVIYAAGDDRPTVRRVVQAIWSAHPSIRSLATFNDRDSTKHADVLSLLDRTIEVYRGA